MNKINSRFLWLVIIAVLLFALLDGHDPAQASISCLPHLSHTTEANGFKDLVWAEFFANHGAHSFGLS